METETGKEKGRGKEEWCGDYIIAQKEKSYFDLFFIYNLGGWVYNSDFRVRWCGSVAGKSGEAEDECRALDVKPPKLFLHPFFLILPLFLFLSLTWLLS